MMPPAFAAAITIDTIIAATRLFSTGHACYAAAFIFATVAAYFRHAFAYAATMFAAAAAIIAAITLYDTLATLRCHAFRHAIPCFSIAMPLRYYYCFFHAATLLRLLPLRYDDDIDADMLSFAMPLRYARAAMLMPPLMPCCRRCRCRHCDAPAITLPLYATCHYLFRHCLMLPPPLFAASTSSFTTLLRYADADSMALPPQYAYIPKALHYV